MDASTRTANKKDRALYVFNSDKSLLQKEQPDVQSAEVVLDRTKGAFLPLVPVCVFSLNELIVQILLDQLTYTATYNIGPTKSSRLNYIFMATVAMAYNWVTPLLSGTKDAWNWDLRSSTELSQMDIYVFVNHALIAVLPTLIPGYKVQPLLVDEQARMNWTPAAQTTYVTSLQTNTKFSLWLSNWQIWRLSRVNDGNVAASVPPTAAQLPNHSTFLNTAQTQDISAYNSPSQWTPLFIQGKISQKYMTWRWNTVRTTCLTAQDEQTIKDVANQSYPTTTRDTDIEQLVSTVTQLNDQMKVQAEFWAGGPYTVSPPGMYMYLWGMFAKNQTMNTNTFMLSGLEVAVSLFETGRIVWGLKYDHMECRPIQDIRGRYAGSTISAYDGTLIDGNLWMPYQVPSFVTPPFADFPSGHSAFGQTFVNVMTTWFGSDIPQSQPYKLTKMYLLNSIFTKDQIQPTGTFLFPKGMSQIQHGVVPSNDVLLKYTTWEDMAISCGYSRQYGGIHAMSAHLGSQALANTLTPLVRTAWGFY